VAVAEARDVDPEHDPGGRAGLDGGGRGGPTAGEAAAGGPAGLPVAAGGGDGLGLAGGLAALALAAVAVLGGVGGLAGLSGGLVALAAVVVVLGLVVGGLAAQAGDRGLALGFLGGGDFLAGLHLGLHRHDRVGGLAEQGGGGLLVVREGGEAGDDGAELLVGHRVVVGPLAQRMGGVVGGVGRGALAEPLDQSDQVVEVGVVALVELAQQVEEFVHPVLRGSAPPGGRSKGRAGWR